MSAPPFTTLMAVAAPIDHANVDTDQIVPVRFIRTPRSKGYGSMLFHDLRFDEQGGERAEFVLNKPNFREARILVADRNFGVGSSREQAVWAISDHGIRCVFASSFGDIFYNNAINHGVLLVREDSSVLAALRAQLWQTPGMTIALDLEAQTWRTSDGTSSRRFDIEPARKRRLLEGLDEIEMTRQLDSQILAFEANYRSRRHWLFPDA
jgi:3-isopropylmalate/(R)-2-methylmalate dehydratase small subunit